MGRFVKPLTTYCENNYGTILYGPILEIAPWNRDPTRTLDSYADLAEANVVDFFEREEKVFFELTSRSNVALDSGVEGTRIEYRWRRTQENCIVGRFDVLLLIGSQFYQLAVTGCENSIDVYRLDLEAMVSSFATLSAAQTALLSPGEARTAVLNYLLKEIGEIPIAEKRQQFREIVGEWALTSEYVGDNKWLITGLGMSRTVEGRYRWTDGRWELEKYSLRISPINSEAVTLLEFLGSWK